MWPCITNSQTIVYVSRPVDPDRTDRIVVDQPGPGYFEPWSASTKIAETHKQAAAWPKTLTSSDIRPNLNPLFQFIVVACSIFATKNKTVYSRSTPSSLPNTSSPSQTLVHPHSPCKHVRKLICRVEPGSVTHQQRSLHQKLINNSYLIKWIDTPNHGDANCSLHPYTNSRPRLSKIRSTWRWHRQTTPTIQPDICTLERTRKRHKHSVPTLKANRHWTGKYSNSSPFFFKYQDNKNKTSTPTYKIPNIEIADIYINHKLNNQINHINKNKQNCHIIQNSLWNCKQDQGKISRAQQFSAEGNVRPQRTNWQHITNPANQGKHTQLHLQIFSIHIFCILIRKIMHMCHKQTR
jgi:hypothetical protein